MALIQKKIDKPVPIEEEIYEVFDDPKIGRILVDCYGKSIGADITPVKAGDLPKAVMPILDF